MTQEETNAPSTPYNWSDRSVSIGKLAAALSKAQAVLEAAKKDANNPFFKSKYADLSSVWAAVRGPLTANELSILQEPSTDNGWICVTTTLLHSSGEYVRSSLSMPVVKQDPHGYGSAVTYARRYALQSVMGIAPEDEDGNAASQPAKRQTPQPAASSQPKYYYNLDTLPAEKTEKAAQLLRANGAQNTGAAIWESSVTIDKLAGYLVSAEEAGR